MNRLVRRLLPLALVLAPIAVPTARAEEADDPLAGFSAEKALAYAKELSSDAMLGRRTAFEGGRRAEAWMVSRISASGMHPMDGSGAYLEPFNFPAAAVSPPIALSIEGEALEYPTQFVDLLYSGSGKVEAEVVFVGYGIAAPDRGWDDYADLDVRGKVVLVLRGAPASRESEFEVERQIGWKSAAAAERGAAGFLVAEGAKAVPGTIQAIFHRPGLPALWIDGASADRILEKRGRTLADLKATRDAGEPGRSFGTGVKVALEVNAQFWPAVKGHNVLAGIRGTDPDLRHEVVLVGAHLDHLGTDALGRVFNGADDNASGAAVLLALAETLKDNRFRPLRTVVFCWFGAEEQGLEGSRALAAFRPFPHRSLVAVLNVDMAGVGRPEVAIGGGEAYPQVFDLAAAACPKPYAASLTPFRVGPNSDHWPFYERGIPALSFHSLGDRPNYHQLTDDAEHLQVECLEAVGRVVGSALVALATHPEPLASGREAAGYVLREGPRVVEGPAARAALEAALAGPKDAPTDRKALVRAGHAAVVVPLDERDGGAAVAVARLASRVAGRRDVGYVRTASDLVASSRGARTAVLPRLHCAGSAAAFPPVLETYHLLGLRWVAPFDPAVAVADDVRDAILATAARVGLVVDLTGLPESALAVARERLGDAPATYRHGAAIEAEALAALRGRLGPSTLLLLSGGAEAAVLSAEALAGPKDEGLAPVLVVSDETAALEALLAVAPDDTPDFAEPDAAARKRVRSLLGGAFVDLLRRLPPPSR